MTEKEFIKQVKETKERFRKRFEDRGVLTWEDIPVEEQNILLGELGFNNYIVLEWKGPSVESPLSETYRLSLAHNRLKKNMEKLQKAYDEMEEAFEAYKKEVLKNG